MNTNLFKQNKGCKISMDTMKRILCLPIYAELEKDVQDTIIKIIKDNL